MLQDSKVLSSGHVNCEIPVSLPLASEGVGTKELDM